MQYNNSNQETIISPWAQQQEQGRLWPVMFLAEDNLWEVQLTEVQLSQEEPSSSNYQHVDTTTTSYINKTHMAAINQQKTSTNH